MTIRLRADLADGRVMVGPVKGCGGFLGGGTLHAGREKAGAAALAQIGRATTAASEGRSHGYAEPKPGHVSMCPDFNAFGSGDPVAVPLRGTRWSVYEGPAVYVVPANEQARDRLESQGIQYHAWRVYVAGEHVGSGKRDACDRLANELREKPLLARELQEMAHADRSKTVAAHATD